MEIKKMRKEKELEDHRRVETNQMRKISLLCMQTFKDLVERKLVQNIQ